MNKKGTKRRIRVAGTGRMTTGKTSSIEEISSQDNARTILMLIQQIPAGTVATYGQIATLAGIPKNARQVGSVLRSLPPDSGIPWFRVVNSRGEISDRGGGSSQSSQQVLLEDEGVTFNDFGRIALSEFQWKPPLKPMRR